MIVANRLYTERCRTIDCPTSEPHRRHYCFIVKPLFRTIAIARTNLPFGLAANARPTPSGPILFTNCADGCSGGLAARSKKRRYSGHSGFRQGKPGQEQTSGNKGKTIM